MYLHAHHRKRCHRSADWHEGSRQVFLRRHEREAKRAAKQGGVARAALVTRLFDRFADHRNLFLALEHVSANGGTAPGVDGLRAMDLDRTAAWNLIRAIARLLRDGTYRPSRPRPTRGRRRPRLRPPSPTAGHHGRVRRPHSSPFHSPAAIAGTAVVSPALATFSDDPRPAGRPVACSFGLPDGGRPTPRPPCAVFARPRSRPRSQAAVRAPAAGPGPRRWRRWRRRTPHRRGRR
jgi:hypothetical protein